MNWKNIVEKVEEKHKVKVISLNIVGSRMYGTALKNSDLDILGIFLPTTIGQIIGMEGSKIEQINLKPFTPTHVEGTLFSVEKFFKLLLNATPNTWELLFVPENYIVYQNKEVWTTIKEVGFRYAFSKKLKHTFSGYAHAQLRRITSYDREKTDNRKRRELIEKFGWDTKKGMHVIRLMGEVLELFVEKTIHFPRPDNQYLIAIRKGEVPMEEVVEKAKRMEDLLTEYYVKKEDIPNKPDRVSLWNWYINNEFWKVDFILHI